MTWAICGLAASTFLAVFAVWRSTRSGSNYYASHVYGMTPAVHRRYAAIGAVFAAFFAISFAYGWVPVVPLLGVFTLVFIFYFSSFARGFSDEE
jgi:hypothetical protein